ncbi:MULTISPECIES: hypothetical protein [Paenibacillus]|uniref:hypothetical protein n=1 Tax=Paenibacillus TaxID=44249 RepID=UPI0008382452|nr:MULTISPECIES: hypothetical protein [Paenibacillus]GIP24235.1 hypothetical protein J22TS3_45100 [Paenibacillus sp. J22TS3]
MSLAEEITGIAEVIKAKFPDAVVHSYQEPVPAERKKGQFVIMLKQDIRRGESLSQTWVQRQYTVVHYGENARQAVVGMDTLSRYVMNEQVSIPAAGSAGKAIKAESFTYDSAEEQENGLVRCSAVLQIQYREPVAVETFTKLKRVEVRMHNNLKGGH